MTKIKAVVSILLILSLMLGFAACGKDKGDTDETTVETTVEDTTGEETTAETGETTPAVGDTQAQTEATTAATGETQAQGQTQAPTQAPQQSGNSKFPVGTDKAAIVNFYNTAANAVKAYKGQLKVTKKSGAYTKIEKFGSSEAIKKQAEDLLPNEWAKAQPKTLTFNNGVAQDGDKQRTLAQWLPPEDQNHMSKLTAAGIKTAECKQEGNNAKITITLIEETSNSLDFIPPHHSTCVDTIALSSADIKPFSISSANLSYKGATISATINEAGQLLALTIKEPAYITGKVGLGPIKFDAALSGGYNVELSFVW